MAVACRVRGKMWKQYVCHRHPAYSFYKHFASVVTSSAVPCHCHGQQSQIPLEARCKHRSVYTIANPERNTGTIYAYFGWQRTWKFLIGSVTSSHIDLSVTSFIFITRSGNSQGIWKPGPMLLDICKGIAQQIISRSPLKIQTREPVQHPYPPAITSWYLGAGGGQAQESGNSLTCVRDAWVAECHSVLLGWGVAVPDVPFSPCRRVLWGERALRPLCSGAV